MTYSEWIPVPGNRDTLIAEIVENKKFQIRTDKKIDGSNDIRWALGGVGWFTLITSSVSAYKCVRYNLKGIEPFLQRAGIMTFLKTSTQLKVWFDDVLEVTWVYQDSHSDVPCAMRKPLQGMKFKLNNNVDDVSTHYRYQTGTHLFVCLVVQFVNSRLYFLTLTNCKFHDFKSRKNFSSISMKSNKIESVTPRLQCNHHK